MIALILTICSFYTTLVLDSLFPNRLILFSEEEVANKPKSDTKVTRIKASDTAPKSVKKAPAKAVAKAKAAAKATKKADTTSTAPIEAKKNVFARIGGYFKGAWVELRQVRWPNRRATWGLTLAVILFSLFFVVLILLLDTLFKYVFELIIA
jgi:preprotein translocase subunit SecE